ncbi:MAG: branched-chain amino acid ABC transporter permease [Dehalococcoidia bacterium]|nr:branched-chain amino acid ABC transporter permease [Dehalococcoidia bacterium]
MMEFLSVLIPGLAVGAIYGLVALGFVLIFKCSGVLNIAQGQLVLVGSFICYTLSIQLGIPFYLALVLTLGMSYLFGVLIEVVLLRPMVGQPVLSVVMITIAIFFILSSLVMIFYGATYYNYPTYLPTEKVQVAGIAIATKYLWCFILAAVLFVGVFLFFRFTNQGIAMRSIADDEMAAESLGVNVRRLHGVAWGLSFAVSAGAGVLLGTVMTVYYGLGFIGLKAIPAVIVGGLESLGGAMVGGLIIGGLEAVAGVYLAPLSQFLGGIKDVFPYVILMLVLLVKPYGLFGERRIERI